MTSRYDSNWIGKLKNFINQKEIFLENGNELVNFMGYEEIDDEYGRRNKRKQ